MFILHTSNRAENLIEHLVKILEAPQSDVFAKETFLIQSQGMERWLSQQLADKKGLWANFEYLFPARFFNDMSQKLDLSLERDAFSRDNLLWRFEAQLRDLDNPELLPLANYFTGDSDDRKRYQLAQQLAYLFDQYMFLRPDWLATWQRKENIALPNGTEATARTGRWQSALWRQLLENLGTEDTKHRGECWIDAIEALNKKRAGDFKELLPERISVLGINTLSPLYLGFLQALSRHIEVHFYLLNPCQEFWADSNKEVKEQLTLQFISPQPFNDADAEPKNPLLAMLGQQGRDFQILLLEQHSNEIEISSFENSEPEGEQNVLEKIQNDILFNRVIDSDFVQPEDDQTISIHACHTRMREVEVLKDQLIARFDGDNDLSLRDVVVMAPDIQEYLPYIDAVFDDIPYAVADRSLRQTNHLLDVLLRFFELSQSRLVWHEVVAIFEEPVVRERFGLSEADMLMVRHWIEATRIRWGESADHRKDLGLGEFAENSWEAGLERMLMGYAVPTDDEFSDGILPYTDIEGSQAQILGNFYALYKLLKRARHKLAKDRSLGQWLEILYEYSGQLLLENNELQSQWSDLRELFDSLSEVASVHRQPLSLAVFFEHLQSMASEQKTATGFMRGQLTFCSMLPMRAIPFSTIALLGMNEGEFPKVDNRAAFDLMDRDFRRGDRSRRADERYQFLEILVSSRKHLIISYIGQSIKNNDEIPPSVVVSELLDTLEQYYGVSRQNILKKHPLHAFNQRYFIEDSNLFSYSKSAAEIATALQLTKQQDNGFWWQGELTDRDPPGTHMLVELDDLFKFIAHPQQYFVEKHLQLSIRNPKEQGSDTEMFELNNLERFFVNQEWLERHNHGDKHGLNPSEINDDYLKRLSAEGRWPSGQLGERLFKEMGAELEGFIDKIRQLEMGPKFDNSLIDYDIGNGDNRYRLVGKLQHQYKKGNLLYRYARCKPKDQMNAWVNHLIHANSSAQSDSLKITYLMQMDEYSWFSNVEHKQANLLALLDLYREAQTGLSSLILPAAFAWGECVANSSSRSKKTPSQIAFEAFEKNLTYDSYWQLLYRNGDMKSLFVGDAFQNSIHLVIDPLIKAKQSLSY